MWQKHFTVTLCLVHVWTCKHLLPHKPNELKMWQCVSVVQSVSTAPINKKHMDGHERNCSSGLRGLCGSLRALCRSLYIYNSHIMSFWLKPVHAKSSKLLYLISVARVSSAYQMGCCFRWVYRYTFSAFFSSDTGVEEKTWQVQLK